jgi:hypothetical protein
MASPSSSPTKSIPVASLPAQMPPLPVTMSSPFEKAFHEGEECIFAIRYGAITAGYSSLTVPNKDVVSGRSAYHLLSEAHSSGIVDTFFHVNDRNEAWLDAEIPRTLRYSKNIREGKYRVEETVDLDQEKNVYRRHENRLDKKTTEDREGKIPPNVLDVFSSLYYVRTLPLEVGKSFSIDVHSGDKVYPLVVNVKKRERVKVKAGKFDCFLVEPVLRDAGMFIAKGKKLEVWLTADDRHLPVLMRCEVFIGHVSAELVRQRTPAASVQTAGISPGNRAN